MAHAEDSNLPEEAKAFLATIAERESGITVICRSASQTTYSAETHGSHYEQCFTVGRSYVKSLFFTSVSGENLFDLGNVKNGFATAFDGEISYVQHLSGYGQYNTPPRFAEKFSPRDLMAEGIPDLKRLHKMGETNPLLLAGGAYIQKGLDTESQDALSVNPYFILLGKYPSSCAFGASNTTWKDVWAENKVERVLESNGLIMLRYVHLKTGTRIELRVDPAHEFLYAGSAAYNSDGTPWGRIDVEEYKTFDGVLFPSRARGILYARGGARGNKEYRYEILDLVKGTADGVAFGPGAVFVNGVQGEYKATKSRFQYNAHADRVDVKGGGLNPMNQVRNLLLENHSVPPASSTGKMGPAASGSSVVSWVKSRSLVLGGGGFFFALGIAGGWLYARRRR